MSTPPVSLDLDEIETIIELMMDGLSETPDDDPNKQLSFSILGKTFARRYNALREVDDLEKAINYTSNALTLLPTDHPDFSDMHLMLATAHRARFRHLGELDDIKKAVESAYKAVGLTPDSHLDLPAQLVRLVLFHSERFKGLGGPKDLNDAIEYESLAVELTPDNDPYVSDRLAGLAKFHNSRFEYLGMIGDLQKAIEYGSRALALTPDGHPAFSDRFSDLGISYTYRFDRLGEPGDLDNAIQFETRALASTPDGHLGLPIKLGNLGASYCHRFKLSGELGELETAIKYLSRALDLMPNDHHHLPGLLNNLGVSHRNRFQYLGELDDLEKAIRYESRAVSLTSDGHPKLPRWLTSLGTSYLRRFEILDKKDDIENAIKHQSRALELTPDDHPYLANRLANLGASYFSRFESLGDRDDLGKAIEYQLRALSLTPEDSKDLSSHLANLARAHKNRFQQYGELGDLEKAMNYECRALSLIPEGHPLLSAIQSNQAISLFEYYQHTGDLSHLQQSIDSFRTASHSLTAAPRDKFRSAKQWASITHKHSPCHCIEAYQTTIDLLPQFIWLGATNKQRYQDLLTAQTLAVDAAEAAILSLNNQLALEWLEHARCVVWNQNLMLRSPLDHLQSIDPDLGTRLQSAAEQLHCVSSESRESRALASGSKTPEQVAQEHRLLAKKYNDLLTQARALPGFENFLQPMKADSYVCAARNGPIVVLLCHQSHCNALLIIPGQGHISHIPLTTFTLDKARHARSEIELSLGRKGLRERGVKPLEVLGQKNRFGNVLAVLWSEVVKPILEFLGYTNNVSQDKRPHITWCPTGALSFLPLHAAGDYEEPRSRVFDFVISSYTPTLNALLSSTPNSLSCDSRVLAIGLESTPGHSPLLGTAGELACIQGHVQNMAKFTQLVNNQATTTAVLDAMEQHDWVHLACHAHQNVVDPTKSGFFLHDGILDLASINQRTFKKKGLAFLSACQTARGDESLPDEAVHIASGLLMAGYTSVIATMWSVLDSDAPLVADNVYRQLMKNGRVGNGEAGKALDDAVAALRQRVGGKEFERWVPYIHMGS